MKNSFEVLLLWLSGTFKKNQDELLKKMDTKMESIQNLFKTSAEATVSPSDILEGQTAYNGTALITGNMKDRRGTTVTATTVTQDNEYTYLSLPEKGCYDENSKVRALNSDLKPNLDNIQSENITANPYTCKCDCVAVVKHAWNQNVGETANYKNINVTIGDYKSSYTVCTLNASNSSGSGETRQKCKAGDVIQVTHSQYHPNHPVTGSVGLSGYVLFIN